MTEPARCIWCKVAVSGQFALGSACPHCGKRPLVLESVPEARAERTYGNEPTREPDLTGPGGRAWRVTSDASDPRHQVACGQWLVNAPGAHPFWPWYAIQAVSLADAADVPQAYVQFPGASHEWLAVALNPEHPLPDIDRWGEEGSAVYFLEPVDQAWQFIVANDDQARELCDLTIQVIVIDGVSPDQDLRRWWEVAIANTAEHIRLGEHPDGPASVSDDD